MSSFSKFIDEIVKVTDKGANYENRPMAVTYVEMAIFDKLPNIKLVVDVGGGYSLDYLDKKPDIEYHVFEPDSKCFEKLKENVGERNNVTLNEMALWKESGVKGFSSDKHTMEGSQAKPESFTHKVKVTTLDKYVKKKGIKKIDFLKIDAEGCDYDILKGAKKILNKTKYVQYETWNDEDELRKLMEKDFEIIDIGARNFICKKKYHLAK